MATRDLNQETRQELAKTKAELEQAMEKRTELLMAHLANLHAAVTLLGDRQGMEFVFLSPKELFGETPKKGGLN